MAPGYTTSSNASSPQSRSMTGGDGIMMMMNSFDVNSNGHAACARRHRSAAHIRSRSARPLELVRVDHRRALQLCLLLRHGHRVHGHASKCTFVVLVAPPASERPVVVPEVVIRRLLLDPRVGRRHRTERSVRGDRRMQKSRRAVSPNSHVAAQRSSSGGSLLGNAKCSLSL